MSLDAAHIISRCNQEQDKHLLWLSKVNKGLNTRVIGIMIMSTLLLSSYQYALLWGIDASETKRQYTKPGWAL